MIGFTDKVKIESANLQVAMNKIDCAHHMAIEKWASLNGKLIYGDISKTDLKELEEEIAKMKRACGEVEVITQKLKELYNNELQLQHIRTLLD